MRSYFLVLEIKRAFWLVAAAAIQAGMELVLLTADADRHRPEAIPEPFRRTRERCRVIPVPDWDDVDAVLSTVRKLEETGRVAGVIANQDEPLVAQAALRQRYGLPGNSPDLMAAVLNKLIARRKLIAAGLSGLDAVPGSEADGWTAWPAGKQYFFKTCYGSGKRGVTGPLCGLEGLARAKAEWARSAEYCAPVNHRYLHRAGYYLEEAFCGAELLSVEGLWSGGRFHPLGIWSRFLDWTVNPFIEMGGAFPWPHPHRDAIFALVEASHRALGLSPDAGPTHTEVLVRPNGTDVFDQSSAEVCEVNHRFGGIELVQCVSLALGVDMAIVLRDWAMGRRIGELDPTPRQYVAMQCVYPPPAAGPVLESIEFPSAADVVQTLQYYPSGTRCGDPKLFASQIGSYLVAAATFEGAAARAKELRAQVRVNGIPAGY